MFKPLAATLMFASTATTALAQEAVPDEIVVVGTRVPDAKTAQRAVNDISVSRDLQIARFHAEVCPVVAGIPAEAATAIRNRILETAKAAGARVANGACDANLIVIFAGDGRALLSDIRNNRPKWLDGVSPAEVDRMMRDAGPVRAWAATTIRNEDGRVASDTGGYNAPSMRVMGASFLQMPTRQHIDGSVIIIDRAAADGRSLAELADYAAMRGLSMTRPPSRTNVDTILSLFSGDAEAPRQLTSFDRGYLRALYEGNGQDRAVLERARIAQNLANGGR